MKEEDDDVSLLSAPVVTEFHSSNEDEIDDDSLLAVEMECEAKEHQHVDYLEGITAEMFGDDEDFEEFSIYSEEEEVEPLPDVHYGLLGRKTVLLQPQGCMDDLPEEVLRQVLCLVPAQDLYRSACLVCHRWRNIVQDTKVRQTRKFKSHSCKK